MPFRFAQVPRYVVEQLHAETAFDPAQTVTQIASSVMSSG